MRPTRASALSPGTSVDESNASLRGAWFAARAVQGLESTPVWNFAECEHARRATCGE
jgi:hypothetical protein